MAIGFGFDSHRLVEGRRLVLGGIEIAFAMGPSGHSDGDCLIHAVCDAILGAAGEGDIGEHFPDTDPAWKDASSRRFLEDAARLLVQRRLTIENIDATVVLEKPILSPYKRLMAAKIASALGVADDKVNIKAKRPEGFEESHRDVVSAFAVVSLQPVGYKNVLAEG